MKILTVFISFLAAILGATISSIFAYKSNAHEESRWREKLLTLASTDQVTNVELNKLRSFVHAFDPGQQEFQECDDIGEIIILFYKHASDSAYFQSNHYLPNTSSDHLDVSSFRLLCRVELKFDWNNQTHRIKNMCDKALNRPNYNDKLVQSMKKYLVK